VESIPLLRDMLILLGISVPLSIGLARLGLPTIVGFFVSGMIIGPQGFGLVTETETVEVLAHIGIVLLLFTIGLEFSVKRMLGIKREVMLGGGLQIGLTTLFVWLFMTLAGQSFEVALLLGFIVSMSSSAIVFKLLADRGDLRSAHGNLSVGILLFQDISIVWMVMVIQGIAGEGGLSGASVVRDLGIAALAIFAIMATTSYIVPRLFNEVVKLRNREVFILTIVLVCLGTAWASSLVGLSLAMGAFIAGLVISESEYSHQIVAEVLPFKDTFSSLFFVSIGMLLELNFFISNLLLLCLLTMGILLVKTVVLVLAGRILRYPLRLSIIVGLNLAQIGEFSFILIKMGEGFGFLPHDLYQLILAVSIITMALTPFIFNWSAGVANFLGRRLGTRVATGEAVPHTHLTDHVIIVGYGLNGRNLARVLKETGIEHLVVDINVERVQRAREEGHKAYFGDASHPEILKRMGVEKARVIVVGITDPVATRRAVKASRDLNPTISIIVRTHYLDEVEDLYRLGATQVIPEEFETSVEIFARVLKEYRVPGNIIQNQIDLVRQEGYAMFRSPSLSVERLARLASILETSVMDTYYVERGSRADGKTLGELDIRRRTGGATVMAVIRKGKAVTNPHGDFKVQAGDLLVLLGSHLELNNAIKILKEDGTGGKGGEEHFWGRGE